MQETGVRNIQRDVENLIQEAGSSGAPAGGPSATARYRKFENQSGKVYIAILDVWTQWTGRKLRYLRKVFSKAQAAYDYSFAVGNRYIRFISFCKEAEDAEIRTEES